MTILSPGRPRTHPGGFRAVPKRVVRRAARRELRDDQSDPIQEHSFITSSFSLVVFGSPWSCSSSRRRLRKVLFLHRQVGSDFCLRPKVGLELLHSTSAQHVAGVSQVFGRHRHRRSMVHRRASTLERHVQKSARHRSRSENENFAQF